MILDSSVLLDPAGSALTASRPSTNVIDILNARDLAGDRHLMIECRVTTALVGPAGTTLNVQWQGSTDNVNWNTIIESGPFPAVSVPLGRRFLSVDLPTQEPFTREPTSTNAFRYFRLNYVISGGPLTAGAMFASLVLDRQNNVTYPKNFTVNS